MNIRSSFVAVAVILSVISAAPANAALVGVTSLAELGTVDTFDWAQLGSTYTVLNGSQNVTSTGGATGTVNSEGGILQRLDQGNGWGSPGGFTTPLLSTIDFAGPDITFTIANPVTGIGAKIEANYFGYFIAQITAYNLIGDVLGVFSEAGISNGDNDDSEIFIGFKSTSAEIAKLRFELTEATSNQHEFAIGTLYTSGGGRISATPLPTGLLLFGTAVLALGAFNLRRRNGFAVA